MVEVHVRPLAKAEITFHVRDWKRVTCGASSGLEIACARPWCGGLCGEGFWAPRIHFVKTSERLVLKVNWRFDDYLPVRMVKVVPP